MQKYFISIKFDRDNVIYIEPPMAGNLNINGNVISNALSVNGVTVEVHESRHLPNGADPIVTASPTTSLSPSSTNGVGIANSLARSDHSHAVTGFQVAGQMLMVSTGFFSGYVTRSDLLRFVSF